MVLSDKVYNVLKWIAQIALPALGTLYFGLSSIWGLPYGEEIGGTIVALDTFLGVLLQRCISFAYRQNVCTRLFTICRIVSL